MAISAATPVCLISASSSWKTSADVDGSRLPVGSSASSSRGALASARAIAVRCCSPPESCEGRCSSRCAEPQHGQQLRGARLRLARGHAADQLRHHDVLERRELRQQLVELVDEAHRAAPHARTLRIAQARAVDAVDDDAPAVGRLEQAGDVQQRRLARTRRPDQRHRLARIERGRRAPQHGDLAVALAEGAAQVLAAARRRGWWSYPARAGLHLTRSAALRRDRAARPARTDRAWRAPTAPAP